jgi:hypothetical protein
MVQKAVFACGELVLLPLPFAESLFHCAFPESSQRSVDHVCVDFFLSSIFCPAGQQSVFMLVLCHFNHDCSAKSFEIRKCDASGLWFLKIIWATQGLLCFHEYFRIVCVYFCKNVLYILGGTTLSL